jgi:D-aminoacyl-tRNA deacylase
MRAVIQRVRQASVSIDGHQHSSVGKGILILLGITHNDDQEDAEWLARKITQLRIFPDEEGVMNRSVLETGGELMVVSQFTLHALTKKGNRPSYIHAAGPEKAVPLYEYFIQVLAELSGKPPKTGIFGAMMDIALINDGPVTIIIDTKNKE